MQGKFLVFFPFIPSLSTTSSAARTLPKALFYYLSSPFLSFFLTWHLHFPSLKTQPKYGPRRRIRYIIMQYARRFLPKKQEEKNVDCNFQALLEFNYGCHNNHNEGALEWPAEGGLRRGRGYVSRTCCVPGWKIWALASENAKCVWHTNVNNGNRRVSLTWEYLKFSIMSGRILIKVWLL